jgi:uncharacterized membrane protein
MSVKRIAARLGVAVSSVSVWVRDVDTPPPAPAEASGDDPGELPAPRAPTAPSGDDPGELPAPRARAAPSGDRPGAPPSPAVPAPRRTCPRCRTDLPISALNRAGDGHQHWCRECFRAYFRERGAKHREQSEAARARRREEARAFLREHLQTHPCADCGEDDIFVLEFDHCRGEKQANIATLLATGAKLERVRGEVALCEVVCVNCHRRRTATHAGWFRVTGVPSPSWDASQRRGQQYVLDVLERSACIDCGERDPVVLDFDHRDAKRANVSLLARRSGVARLEAEIARCDVRCANCHRIRTLSIAPCWRDEDHWAVGLHGHDWRSA